MQCLSEFTEGNYLTNNEDDDDDDYKKFYPCVIWEDIPSHLQHPRVWVANNFQALF